MHGEQPPAPAGFQHPGASGVLVLLTLGLWTQLTCPLPPRPHPKPSLPPAGAHTPSPWLTKASRTELKGGNVRWPQSRSLENLSSPSTPAEAARGLSPLSGTFTPDSDLPRPQARPPHVALSMPVSPPRSLVIVELRPQSNPCGPQPCPLWMLSLHPHVDSDFRECVPWTPRCRGSPREADTAAAGRAKQSQGQQGNDGYTQSPCTCCAACAPAG